MSCQSIGDNLAVFNEQLHFYQHLEAATAWNISLGINTSIGALGDLAISKHLWNSKWCGRLMTQVYQVPVSQREARQIYLFCRGPQFTAPQLRQVIALLSKMQGIYNNKKVFSMRMEPELNNFMEVTRNEAALRSAWIEWFRGIGTTVKPIYEQLVPLLNAGARNAGRQNMGVVWREELETPNLKSLVLKLYSEVKSLYELLHSVVRHKLGVFYQIKLDSTIPAHLLGNMWAQKWDSLAEIVFPEQTSQLTKSNMNPLVRERVAKGKANATPLDAVHSTEDFFTSMGFPRLPQKFYRESYFMEDANYPWKNCHGTAANMYGDGGVGDYRMMMCIPKDNVTDEDLLTLTHEMGHIYYFMAYSRLEPVFQVGDLRNCICM
ncbi:unnamed protein product [Allacma fusca]|uniref:Angiotensin-converting enzyme n=1 Tax=Allacma fusca TaxID=39272 RepID=A0A8J2J8Y4_9HEXA|nr:unnamed protein product [Allacma fusca]